MPLARRNHIQTSFNAGELSPRLHARTDFERYAAGMKECTNFIPLVQGGIKRRSGTRFIREVKDSAKQTTLIPFQFSDVQAYILEVGDTYIRFYKSQGIIVAADTDASISNGTFDTDLTNWTVRDAGTGASTWNSGNGGQLQLAGGGAGNEARRYQSVTIGAGFQSAVHVLRFQVRTNDVHLRIGTSVGGAQIKALAGYTIGHHCVSFTPGASPIFIEFEETTAQTSHLDNVSLIDNAPVEIGSPYVQGDVYILDYAQSADVLWIVHRTYKPMKLIRFKDNEWSLIEFAPTADPFTSATNFPGAVTLFETRVIFAATTNEPDTIWGTKSNDFENMTTGTGDADAFKFTLASDKVDVIQWLAAGRRLLAGTIGEELSITGGNDSPLTPTNIDVDPETAHGSERIRPVKVANASLFIQRGGKKVRELAYVFESDEFAAADLSILAEHLFNVNGVILSQLAYQQEPESVVWAIRDDGQLLAMTYNRKQNVVAWATCPIAGVFGTGGAVVESIATISGITGEVDELWMVVKRTINSVQERYVELLDDLGGSFYTQLHVDSGLTYNGVIDTATLTPGATSGNGVTFTASASVFVAGDVGKDLYNLNITDPLTGTGKATIVSFISGTQVTADITENFPSTAAIPAGKWGIAVATLAGLGHLEGQTVDILGDGSPLTAQVVTGGQVTGLDPKVVRAEVGLGYDSTAVTLRPDFAQSPLQGILKARAELFLRVKDTLGITLNGTQIPFRSTEDIMGDVPAKKTEDIRVHSPNWDRDQFITVEQTQPLPAEILALFGNVTVADEN